MNNYAKFDPMVASGQLPFPAIDMVMGKAPFLTDMSLNQYINIQRDSFVPSKTQNKNSKGRFKSHAITALVTALAVLGLVKFGKSPFTKLKGLKPIQAVKNFVSKIFRKTT